PASHPRLLRRECADSGTAPGAITVAAEKTMSTSARKLVANSLIVCLSLLISLAGLELLVRAFGTVDGEGNFGFAGTTLRPYQLPLADTAQIVAEYAQSDRSRLQYDPKLGWSPRPNSVSRDGLYHYHGQGIRSAP